MKDEGSRETGIFSNTLAALVVEGVGLGLLGQACCSPQVAALPPLVAQGVHLALLLLLLLLVVVVVEPQHQHQHHLTRLPPLPTRSALHPRVLLQPHLGELGNEPPLCSSTPADPATTTEDLPPPRPLCFSRLPQPSSPCCTARGAADRSAGARARAGRCSSTAPRPPRGGSACPPQCSSVRPEIRRW